MASAAQSIRFGAPAAPAAASGSSIDAINRILADLCTRGPPKVRMYLYFSVRANLIVYVSFLLLGFNYCCVSGIEGGRQTG